MQASWILYVIGFFPVLTAAMLLCGLASTGLARRFRMFVGLIGAFAAVYFFSGFLSAVSTGTLAWDLIVAILKDCSASAGCSWAPHSGRKGASSRPLRGRADRLSADEQKHGSAQKAPTTLIRWAGLGAMLGGALWVVLRPLVATTWNNPTFGLTYEHYNRLMVAPLALLLLGALGLHVRYAGQTSGWPHRGLPAIVLGAALMFLGVVVEFYFAGGVNTGDWMWSTVGWMTYLLGYLSMIVGLALFGVQAWRKGLLGRWSGLPLVMGGLGLLWLPVTSFGSLPGAATQVLFGLGWLALGYHLWSSRVGERPEIGSRR